MAATKELKYYFIVLSRCSDRLFCPHCNESLLPKHFENHFSQHGINGKTNCVWCQQVSWPSGEKHKHKKHLLSCFKEFIKSRIKKTKKECRIVVAESESSTNHIRFQDHNVHPINNSASGEYHLLDMTHAFPEKDFFGHQLIYTNNIEDSIWPVENLPPLPISFADENLNLAAACVLLYLTNTLDFFHVMVKTDTMKCFLEAINKDKGKSHTLPFSCWCDGGEHEVAEYRQHRHFIIVSPKNHFRKNVWQKIKVSTENKPPNYLCKKLTAILSPMHLVNTLGYLSQRKSECDFSFFENKSVKTRNNHFYLYKTLPIHFKLHLVLLWEGGLAQYLNQTKFKNVSIPSLAEGVLTHDGRRWTQKIKDFYGHERGMVINVDKAYIPTDNVTPHFLHLMNGQILYFNRSPENEKMDPKLWLQKQVEGGNCFYDNVEESKWIPRPKDQRVLNFYKPVIDKNRVLESKVAELEAKVEMMLHFYSL